MRHVSASPAWRIASRMRSTPVASTSAVNSGESNDTWTWLCAARLYTSSGRTRFITWIRLIESPRSA